jgi:hypothetical protein
MHTGTITCGHGHQRPGIVLVSEPVLWFTALVQSLYTESVPSTVIVKPYLNWLQGMNQMAVGGKSYVGVPLK